MSEKLQGTASSMREKMLHRYDDGLQHKHDKNHTHYRKHFKSHPVITANATDDIENRGSTGLVRTIKLRKLRKRLDKGSIH